MSEVLENWVYVMELSKHMQVIAVGTTNESKLIGVSRAWHLYASARIVAVDVKTSIPYQPLSWYHTFKGSVERARRAFESVDNADYGVGVEAGLLPSPMPSGYMEVQVAVIIDSDYNVSVGMSSAFEIPYIMLKDVLGGKELGVVAENFFPRKNIREKQGVIGLLTSGVITRADLSYQAVLNALLPRINQKQYGPLLKLGAYIEKLEEQSF